MTFGFFSPETFKLVMQSLNPAIIAGLAAAVANLVFFFRRLARAKRLLLFASLTALVYLAGASVVRDVERLEDINDTAAVDVTDLALWERFQAAMTRGGGDVFTRAHTTDGLEIAAQASRASLEDAVRTGRHEIIDVLCLNSPVRGSHRRCQLSWEIYTNLDDAPAIERIMRTYGYEKTTPLLLYCQEGFTSSRLAYILSAYGYDASWASLSEVRDATILDPAFAGTAAPETLIEPLRFDPRRAYVYFLLEYEDQNAFAFDEFFRDATSRSRRYRNVTLVQVPDEYDARLLRDAGLAHRTVRPEPARVAALVKDARVMCRNRLHCYLTRIYLASLRVTPHAISCSRCEDA